MPTLPLPGQPAPTLDIDLVGGDAFKLGDAEPQWATMVVFYRGLHCPVCRKYNRMLQSKLGDLAELGVDVVAVSMDEEDRATKAVEDWGLEELAVGHGLTEESAREWGLYLSSGIKDAEPERFTEPGLFLVDRDGTLRYAAMNSMPWGRPDLDELLKAISWIQDNDYPPRGVVA